MRINKIRLDQRQNRFTRPEQKVANAISLPISLVVMILFYITRIIVMVLFRTKRWIGKIAIVIFIFSSAYNALQGVVEAPKPAHAMDGVKHTYDIPTLDPNLSEREQNIALINRIWGNDAGIGLAIARCESGYRTHAINYNTNYTTDLGIYQMNSVHDMPEMDVAVANISTAYLLYQQQGTTPWNSSKSCWGQ